MPNPFPGMNPYLETPMRWSNMHGRLIAVLMDELDTKLPPGYSVNIEEHCRVAQTERGIYPDLYVKRDLPEMPATGGVAVALPPYLATSEVADKSYIVALTPEASRETYINIVDVENGSRVVASIEILSTINKTPGAGQNLYLTKQQEVLNSSTHLIEIDLLRAGAVTVACGRPVVPESGYYDYIVCLHRGGEGEQFEIWPCSVRQRLPRIAVPLAGNDQNVTLDIQAAIDRCYERGRFAQKIDYTQPPNPPLTEEDAQWADALLREKGLRS